MDKYVSPIPATAKGLQPFRYVGAGDIKAYEDVYFESTNPAMAIDRVFRQMKVFGCVSNSTENEAGICDVLDQQGDVIYQFELTKKGISWLYKKYNLRVLK